MMQNQVSLQNVSFWRRMKSERIGYSPFHSKTANLNFINEVTFSANSGDRIALLGNNGAGKTTLLRIMSGIFKPDSGTLFVEGNVHALLDGGFGFDFRLSGRENLKTRGVIEGMSRSEIREYINWCKDFSELDSYFDRPLTMYSQGMIARLVFSANAYSFNGTLLIDEGLGTADANFTAKALDLLQQKYASSPIVIIASHNIKMLRSICNRGLVLDKGTLISDAPFETCISELREQKLN